MRSTAEQLVAALASDDYEAAINRWLFAPEGRPIHPSGEEIPLSHLVAFSGKLEAVKYLHRRMGNIDACGEDGVTALHCAIAQGDVGMVQCLWEHGADCSKVDKDGFNLLHYIVFCNGPSSILDYLRASLLEHDLFSAQNKFTHEAFDLALFFSLMIDRCVEYNAIKQYVQVYFGDDLAVFKLCNRLNRPPLTWLSAITHNRDDQASQEAIRCHTSIFVQLAFFAGGYKLGDLLGAAGIYEDWVLGAISEIKQVAANGYTIDAWQRRVCSEVLLDLEELPPLVPDDDASSSDDEIYPERSVFLSS
jgi:ankyrin repeat protein